MDLRPIGASGVEHSRVGLGGFELGGELGEVRAARAAIQAALEGGMNWLDTAEDYHHKRNETVIGAALNGMPTRPLIASKVSPDNGGFRPESVKAACRASLARVGAGHFDLYFLHWPDDPGGVPLAETWGAMAELADDGLVRAVGLSNHSLEQIDACHAARPVDVVQEGMSLIDHLTNRSLIRACCERGIAAVVYEPLAGGMLGGAIASIADLEARFEGLEEWDFYHRLYAPGKFERSAAVTDGVRRVGERLGATTAQVAVAWVLAQPGVSAAICGSRNPAHVAANAAATMVELDVDALAELEALVPLGPAFASE